MSGPLDGVRVLDFSTMVSGPVAARMLADQGADVIKVESPKGDEMRRIGNQRNGVTAVFMSCNRGKRGICLDLKNADAKSALRDLVKSADVILQNFRPGAMQRMGFGEADVRALKKDIIYVSIRPCNSGSVRRHRHSGGPRNRPAEDVPHHHRRQGHLANRGASCEQRAVRPRENRQG